MSKSQQEMKPFYFEKSDAGLYGDNPVGWRGYDPEFDSYSGLYRTKAEARRAITQIRKGMMGR